MRAAGLAGRDSLKSNMTANARDIVHSGGCFGPVRMRPMQAEKLDVPTPLAISRSIQVL